MADSMATIRPDPRPGAAEVHAGIALGEAIGAGGTAIVRRAVQVSLGREVAVKQLRPELAAKLAHVVVREARVIAALNHPGVIPVHDLVAGPDGDPQIVMARVHGTSWLTAIAVPETRAALGGAPDPERFHVETLIRVARVVEHAHARGIVHRDLKPENVMLGEHGELYVVDWGLALTTRDDADPAIPRASAARRMAGTPGYMAPEQLGEQPITVATDVFLLGAVLYHALTGAAPYGHLDAPAIFDAVRASCPAWPDRVNPGLAAIARHAMAPDPADRPTATALREALERHLVERHAAALTAEATARATELAAAIAATPDDAARLHHLHGEAVFGFRAALRDAPLPDATDGLRRAHEAMAAWALDRGDPDGAAVFLAELDPAPPALVAQRDALLRQRARDAARLEALARDTDLRVGRVARGVVLYGAAAAWVGLPLVLWAAVDVRDLGHGYNLASSSALLVGALGAGMLLHGPLRPNAINRAVVAALVTVAVGQLALDLGGRGLGLEPHQIHALRLPLWAAVSAMVAATVRGWLVLATVAYLFGFAVVAVSIDALLPVIAWSNGVFAAVALTLLLRVRRAPGAR